MPELKCGVITCVHNVKNYCELDSIEVLGDSATVAEQTSCGSFVERKGEQYGNSTQDVEARSEILCQAKECKYNQERKCYAGKISVMGTDATRVEQTECATFKKES